MEEERIELSARERERLKVLHEVEQGHLRQIDAARRLRLSARQVRRLLRRLHAVGDRRLVHGLRGRPSDRRMAEDIKRTACAGFGPTLASEHWARQGLPVSRETLRKWMCDAGAAGTLRLLKKRRRHLHGTLPRCSHKGFVYHTRHQHLVWYTRGAAIDLWRRSVPLLKRMMESAGLGKSKSVCGFRRRCVGSQKQVPGKVAAGLLNQTPVRGRFLPQFSLQSTTA
jgi:hypothetical protein